MQIGAAATRRPGFVPTWVDHPVLPFRSAAQVGSLEPYFRWPYALKITWMIGESIVEQLPAAKSISTDWQFCQNCRGSSILLHLLGRISVSG